MKATKLKYIIGLVIIISAFSYLVWSSFMGSFKFTLTPSEFKAKEKEYLGKVVKLSGEVDPDSISYDHSDYNFLLSDGSVKLAVHYKGVVPNTFREGAEIVVTGRYDTKSKIFEASQVITKCASKYGGN